MIIMVFFLNTNNQMGIFEKKMGTAHCKTHREIDNLKTPGSQKNTSVYGNLS